MTVQLITYSLKKRGHNYGPLFEAIPKLGKWWNCVENVWMVKTDRTRTEIQQMLYPLIHEKDELVVVGLNGNWATCGFPDECRDWLRVNL